MATRFCRGWLLLGLGLLAWFSPRCEARLAMPPQAPEPGLMKLVKAVPDQLALGELVGAVPYPGKPWLAVLSRRGMIRLQSTDP
ncbi:MAG: hypothetical protein ACKO3N_22095, partial [Verrucomicrobiota bacterium]